VIIKAQPFYKEPTFIPFHPRDGRSEYEIIRAKAYQMIVYVSVTRAAKSRRGFEREEEFAASFPAILDTGLNDNLCINALHLFRWTGLTMADFPIKRMAEKTSSGTADRREANVWLHRNSGKTSGLDDRGGQPFQRPFAASARPHWLNCHNILVFPPPASGRADDVVPRLPTLGLRALAESRLNIEIRLKNTPCTLSVYE
jgi:hypothetical protein